MKNSSKETYNSLEVSSCAYYPICILIQCRLIYCALCKCQILPPGRIYPMEQHSITNNLMLEKKASLCFAVSAPTISLFCTQGIAWLFLCSGLSCSYPNTCPLTLGFWCHWMWQAPLKNPPFMFLMLILQIETRALTNMGATTSMSPVLFTRFNYETEWIRWSWP